MKTENRFLVSLLHFARTDMSDFYLGMTLGMAAVRYSDGDLSEWEYEYVRNIVNARRRGVSA